MSEDQAPPAGPSASDSSTPSPARLRAEARKQKILSKGNDRLAKITGAMKGTHFNSQPETVKDEASEPPEVDISLLNSNDQPSPSNSSKPPGSSSEPSLVNREKKLHRQSSKKSRSDLVSDPSLIPPPMTSNDSDPMLQMMRAMGLELPNLNGMPSSTFDPGCTPNPIMQQTLAGLNGMSMANQQPIPKNWVDRVFPLLNLIAITGLILAAKMWWVPMTDYWRLFQDLGSNDRNSQIDLQAEWAALHPAGSTPAVRHALGPAPVFWMFVTFELTLQATRWMFNRGSATPPGLLGTLIYSLPRPYSILASTAMKYFAIISSLVDDLCLLVFGVGCAVMWLEWRNLNDHSLFSLLQPS